MSPIQTIDCQTSRNVDLSVIDSNGGRSLCEYAMECNVKIAWFLCARSERKWLERHIAFPLA
ncbi:hypothetical protein CBM2592_P310007 [Cupriavidus taiwanensis]|uniref:Uncharacterized protein n=1 Tax=Cupriavidus neocaledonicus TaxID=1040979 RepID=A0ABY1VCW6_9BURK|nr:hypothetical protein CBM2592_P310007 [Cupriavidus taiwanensis]SOZ40563.1 hypothetical protein CBM2605_P280007 [Cupriavidus neocaledonicus]SPD61808.1 protein of unknown function [Cupriavidus taiwanensis]